MKERDKKKKEKKLKSKSSKDSDNELEEEEDHIEFGELVDRPPTLSVVPKQKKACTRINTYDRTCFYV
jgi:hypothetical protein